MTIKLNKDYSFDWKVEKIAVIGPGIVGMPMASLLASAKIKIGTTRPAKVLVVQRKSENSGWKVDAINSGKSVIGGIEPDLNTITEKAVKAGLLSATSDFNELTDADVVLVSIQTDKDGYAPDYGPLLGGLSSLARALQNKPEGKIPLIIFESTLAPSSMATVISDHFAKFGLVEGRDILLGNSPNRVMPGRLVERVTSSDKLVAGLHPETPKMIQHLYKHIVLKAELFATNSMTAEVVKTLENAYRDVRIAFSADVVRYCDENDIDFYALRNKVNKKLAQEDNASADPNAVPSGGILIPMLGVGGHCLPKDGILLWWRRIDSKADTSNSLILNSRFINDESPTETIRLAEKSFGFFRGKKVAILGAAYRFNSEDTRNSPSIQLALRFQERDAEIILQDPYVKPDDQNLLHFKLNDIFTRDLEKAITEAEYIFIGTAHKAYIDGFEDIIKKAPKLKAIIDASNIYSRKQVEDKGIAYTGIGRGSEAPKKDFVDFVYKSFRIMERGLANEVMAICTFLNKKYAHTDFNKVDFTEVQRLAGSCSTGCEIANTGAITEMPDYKGKVLRLVKNAFDAAKEE
ncbi:MAG: nucleotide sugar dehydrogenase [Bacteroidales bacterium]|nr:nucleotide sugar dehydrogenase [Bacteroidales bacterium]MCF8454713.1 nucleotide sugar dehydrogenase [Bacteroidales bacterium]